MKIMKVIALPSLLAGLLLTTTGCIVDANGGGKLVDDCTGEKVTFGFWVTADIGIGYKCVDGELQLVEHAPQGGNIIIHGMFDDATQILGMYCASGTCTVKGGGLDGTYDFEARVLDLGEPGNNDWIMVKILGAGLVYTGVLDGGNIDVID